jgi:uncharacterized protein YndB with AHSA1/START domain
MNPPIERSVLVNAAPEAIWKMLTDPASMKQWMAEPETELEIHSDWKVGSSITITGTHHGKFENKGVILKFDTNKTFSYSHLSSVSQLDDKPENYTVLEFNLCPVGDQTSLTLTIRNFPTETIYKHLEFYWGPTLQLIKNIIEKDRSQNV